MLKRWFWPLLAGIIVAALTCYIALLAVPRGLMSVAHGRLAKVGVNAMHHVQLATDKARTVVRPSPDLAYSSCPFDLSVGPVLVDVAPVAAPYWSLSVFDGRTNSAFVRNNLQSGGAGLKVALIRDGQSPSTGYQPVRVPTDKGIALIRVLVPNRAAFGPIDAARRKSGCRPA